MQSKQILLIFIFASCIITAVDAWGKDKKSAKPKKQKQKINKVINKPKPVPGMFTVTGVVSKTVINDKETYILTSPAGNITYLPTPKQPAGQAADDSSENINLELFINQRVSIFGKGISRQVKNLPNPKVFIKEIINIRQIEAEEKKTDNTTQPEKEAAE